MTRNRGGRKKEEGQGCTWFSWCGGRSGVRVGNRDILDFCLREHR